MTFFLSAEGVSATLPDGTLLLDSIEISLSRGVTGLAGPNGAGKSTLFEILAGLRRPARGRVLRSGAAALLPQGGAPESGETAASLLASGAVAAWRVAKAPESVGLGGLDLSRAASTLSGGEATRLRLARLLLEEPRTVLLDEPTNHLDEEARRSVRAFVSSFRGAVFVATHDRELLAGAGRIAELRGGRLRLFGGGWEAYLEARRGEREAAAEAVRSAGQALDAARQAAREASERQALTPSTLSQWQYLHGTTFRIDDAEAILADAWIDHPAADPFLGPCPADATHEALDNTLVYNGDVLLNGRNF